ncbi:Uncharacterized protein PODLI_1B040396 [Podarcis lilfordi]|uniref:Perilipin 1 n=1 Tax=Podarcis lilfordi TaxID=74358 RepID=A0AA35LAF2_9SAUR|nr:Uncharacterized protein PODLI_1B040396 [Podarcis lilfordi]
MLIYVTSGDSFLEQCRLRLQSFQAPQRHLVVHYENRILDHMWLWSDPAELSYFLMLRCIFLFRYSTKIKKKMFENLACHKFSTEWLKKEKKGKMLIVPKFRKEAKIVSRNGLQANARMAAKSKQLMQNGTPKGNDNALQRVLHLPVVNSACSNLQKAYSVTKEVHPLMASVCGAYERGLQNAGSIAASSVKPVVKKLEPQLAAANILTCRGLDHLEQKIPALNQPVEKVTSDLKDSIVTYMQSAMRSVMHTLDRVMGLGVKSCKQPKGSLKDAAEYARTSRVSQLAEAGVDAAIGKLEKLVDFFLPKTEHESVHKPPGRCELSTFGRIRSLAVTAFHRAYKKTTQNIQHVRDKGQDLATWIPGLVVLARQSSKKVLKIITGVQSAETGWLSKKVQKVPKEEEETKKDDTGRKTAKQVEAQSLVGSVSQNLQTSCFSIASRVKDAPATVWNAAGQLLQVSPQRAMSEAGDKVDLLKETFHNITGNLLGTFSSYVPVSHISLLWDKRWSGGHIWSLDLHNWSGVCCSLNLCEPFAYAQTSLSFRMGRRNPIHFTFQSGPTSNWHFSKAMYEPKHNHHLKFATLRMLQCSSTAR